MPKPTAEQLAEAKRNGPIRLACSVCDRDDYDGVKLFPGWPHIEEIQSLEASLTTYDDDDPDPPPGYCVMDWYTHIGLCPECQIDGHE